MRQHCVAVLVTILVSGMAIFMSPSYAQTPGSIRVATKTVAREFRDCRDCPVMVRIPGGTFQMGDLAATGKPDEKPVHTVTVPAFAVGKFSVTIAEYQAFASNTNRVTPEYCRTDRQHTGIWTDEAISNWRDPGIPQTSRHPVVCVTWEDARAYAAWLAKKTGKAYRLLSESEWEYAARAGTSTEYWWGNDINDMCAYANGPDLSAKNQFPKWDSANCNDGHVYAAPVGSYRPNAFGLYDMGGNTWQWIEDCYEPSYDLQPRDGSAYTQGTCRRRALRGGSWVHGLPDLRAAQRNGLPPPQMRGGDIGFRVARGN